LAARIRERGDLTELRGEAVHADTLFMDFDGHTPTSFLEWLRTSGLAWQEWDSGGRSVHVHIPIEPVCAPWLPDAMRAWTKQHAPSADTSFLHPAGMFRLPFTYHPKSGLRKELVAEGDGARLVLTEPATPRFAAPTVVAGTHERFLEALLQPCHEGKRRPHLWVIGRLGAEAGLEFDEVFEQAKWWARTHCHPPHPDSVVMRQIETAFKQLRGRA
jgi:hypothetical protein